MINQNLAVQKKVFFFFQAEDGIRDATVTGVQTCALPISAYPICVANRIRWASPPERLPEGRLRRSEERRVGKEWRTRWSRDDEIKNSRRGNWRVALPWLTSYSGQCT